MASFFDCDCAIGRQAIPMPGSFHTAGELLEEMDYFGIERALVWHVMARDHFPAEGNQRLLAEIAGQPRLAPCWVVMPHHTGEMAEPQVLVDQMLVNGVRAARIFPGKRGHSWSLADWSAGPLLAALAAAAIPVFVDAEQVAWDVLHRTGATFPTLPLVVTLVRYDELRVMYPLLEATPNLHIDTSRLSVHWGLETLVAKFGPERFLFGSHMPQFTAGPGLMHINFARISEDERALIAGGNLARLLAGAGRGSGG